MILDGDLRELVGGKLSIGDPLFELARYDRMSIVLKIPEHLVLSARECVSAIFAASARPETSYPLDGLRIAPASTVLDEKNVFLGESLTTATLEGLAPGMEGVARLDAGFRPAWWVLSHRLIDWLRLNFWV